MQSESNENNAPPKAGQLKNVLPAQPSVTDEKILAEFERLVLAGHSRENAKRLTRDLFGRAALGTGGRSRAAIHDIVVKSKVRQRKPKKADSKVETEAEDEQEAKGETEDKAQDETVTELATEAFNAEGIWEPDEGAYNLLVEALKNARNAGTPLNIDLASEILKAILAGGSHVALPAAQAEATTIVPFEAPAPSVAGTEALPAPALVELEAEVTRTFERLRESSWECAVALTKIHDSKLYPDSASAGSWERYMLGRWGIRRAQAFNIVAWVHDEITLNVSLPSLLPIEEGKSTPVDLGEAPVDARSTQGRPADATTEGVSGSGIVYPVDSPTPTPPAIPIHKTERASRAARSKPRPRKIRGKLNDGDLANLVDEALVVPIEGSKDYMARTEADRRVSEGTLAKVETKYYDPSAKSGDWFLLSIEDNNDGLVETFERFIEARSSHPNFTDLLARLAVLVTGTPAS
jgi:hypothetical protein